MDMEQRYSTVQYGTVSVQYGTGTVPVPYQYSTAVVRYLYLGTVRYCTSTILYCMQQYGTVHQYSTQMYHKPYCMRQNTSTQIPYCTLYCDKSIYRFHTPSKTPPK